jgi:hypothetical protein
MKANVYVGTQTMWWRKVTSNIGCFKGKFEEYSPNIHMTSFESVDYSCNVELYYSLDTPYNPYGYYTPSYRWWIPRGPKPKH